MRRPKSAHALQEDLQDLVETVTPKVEAAFHTVAENAQPALAKGRAIAAERGAQLAEALADRIPDDVVDRLPESVSDHLPKKRRRGRTLLLVGAVAGLGAVAFSVLKRGQTGSHVAAAPAPEPAPRPRAVLDDPIPVPSTEAPVEATPAAPADPVADEAVKDDQA